MNASRLVAVLLAALAAASAYGAAAQEGQDAGNRSGAAAQAPDARPAPAVPSIRPRGKAAAAPAPRNKLPPRRRSVQQIIATVPPPQLAGPAYGPTLYPRAPAPAPAPGSGMAPVNPPPPAVLAGCQGNFCTDTAGHTYNAGVGNAAVDANGRLCSRVGVTLQCF